MTDFNKNEKQHNFNQIKGVITEMMDGEKFCHITLNVGHENKRLVNGIVKKEYFETLKEKNKIGDKVTCSFYVSSRFKEGHWRTMVNILNVEPVQENVKPLTRHAQG